MDDSYEQFQQIIFDTFAMAGKQKPSEGVVFQWRQSLKAWTNDEISFALNAHFESDRYLPWPADVNRILNNMDGRPCAEEAWAIAVGAADEYNSVCWTQEIADAWSHCVGCYEPRNTNPARMAFNKYYPRLVEQVRKAQIPVKWSVSLGHDQEIRQQVLEHGIERGLLDASHTRHLLVAPVTDAGREVAGLLGFVGNQSSDDSTDEGDESVTDKSVAHEQVLKIKAALGGRKDRIGKADKLEAARLARDKSVALNLVESANGQNGQHSPKTSHLPSQMAVNG